MATITFKRPKRFTNGFRNYKILLDGKLLGTIANGETKTFVTEAVGKHQLHATIDWCSSPLLSTIIASDENKKIVVDLHRDFSKNWSYFFYSGFSILILDFILSKTLNFHYALVLMVFPLLFMFYLLIFKQKIALQLSEIVNI